MGKSVIITSGKGGVGKSTVASNIGAGLAFDSRKVLLIDMDIGLRSLDLLLGNESEIVYDLNDVLEGNCDYQDAMYADKTRPGLMLMPAAQHLSSASVSPGDMRALVNTLKKDFDYILLDCPAGIGRGFRNTEAAADEAIIVLTGDAVSLRGAERVKELLNADGITRQSFIVNRITRASAYPALQAASRLEIPALGYIPEDKAVAAAAASGKPVIDTESPAGDAFERIVKRILGTGVKYAIPHINPVKRIIANIRKENICRYI